MSRRILATKRTPERYAPLEPPYRHRDSDRCYWARDDYKRLLRVAQKPLAVCPFCGEPGVTEQEDGTRLCPVNRPYRQGVRFDVGCGMEWSKTND